MNRELISRNAPGGELNGNVHPLPGDHFDDRITITAYRGGDKFLFEGRISKIASNGVTASFLGSLTVGELVCLRYCVDSLGTVERHARVGQHQCERYDFNFLSLNAHQLQCLAETCDWLLADLS